VLAKLANGTAMSVQGWVERYPFASVADYFDDRLVGGFKHFERAVENEARLLVRGVEPSAPTKVTFPLPVDGPRGACHNPWCTTLPGPGESTTLHPLRTCAGCRVAKYDSAECQEQAWSCHRAACNATKARKLGSRG